MHLKNKELIAGTAAFSAAVAVFVLISFNPLARRHPSSSYSLSARFNHADGLNIGADVRLAGIKVGEVVQQKLDDHYGVVVTFSLPKTIALPDDSGASVQSQSLLGAKYIELAPGGSEDMLGDGDAIDFTEDSPNLERLLDKIIAIAKADRQNRKCPEGK